MGECVGNCQHKGRGNELTARRLFSLSANKPDRECQKRFTNPRILPENRLTRIRCVVMLPSEIIRYPQPSIPAIRQPEIPKFPTMTASPRFYNLPQTKKDRILAVASDEFCRKGYAAASLNIMVERLGIAKGSLFQYFGSKSGLFRFVFEQALDKVKNHLRRVREETSGNPLPMRLEATLWAGSGFIREHPEIYKMYLQLLTDDTIPFRNEMTASLRQSSFRYLREMVQEACDRGELGARVEPEMAAFLLDAVMDRFLQAQAVLHMDAGLKLFHIDPSSLPDRIRQLVHLIGYGIIRLS